MKVVDAHVHVWDLDRADYPWLGPHVAPLNRTFSIDEVAPTLASRAVDGVVLVQAADNRADTEHMIELARSRSDVLGVVAWVPLENPAEAAALLAELRGVREVVGIRNLIHDRVDADWVLRPEFDAGLSLLEEAGLPFDYVTSGPAALAHLPELGRRHPGLRMVIDHLGKPPVGGSAQQFDEWRELLANAAANPLVSAKVSGLHSASDDPAAWTVDDVRPVFEYAVEAFGASRLMLGSDWPVCLLAGGYERWWDVAVEFAGSLESADRDAILGGTATAVYGLPGSG